MRRVFSTDPDSGITRYWRHNPGDDTAYLETVQEIDDTLDSNKAAYNGAESGWKGDMHKVASIPMVLYYQLKREGILDDEKRLKSWLNSPENKYFRTRPGRL